MSQNQMDNSWRTHWKAFVAGVVVAVVCVWGGIHLLTTTSAEARGPGLRTEVHPGELDDYYGFFSGGQSGEIRVVGIPSMRVFKRIPVFNLDSASGWGITNESKAMMGGMFVGDTHHAHGSYTDGTYNGKYLWVNDKANNRLARIDIRYLEVDKILSIPHTQGTHGIFPQRYPETEWIVLNSEFRTPLINDGKGDIRDHTKYGGVHTIVDAEKMEVICQITVPINLDLAATDYGGKYSFATSYNSEGGATISEMLAKDRDYLVVFNWDRIKANLKKGKYTIVDGVKMMDGAIGSDLTIFIPVAKNPHGVNISPDGKYAVCSGKVSPTATLIAIDKLADAFAGKIDPKDCIVGNPEIGLGPLHTTFDGRGNAYTSLFIDSQIVKWNIQKAIDLYTNPNDEDTAVLDRLDVHYQVGHTMASMAETKEADGNFLVALNKISKDRFLNVGPIKPENDQLIDITGDKMVILHEEPAYIEPHDCIIVRRDIIEPIVLHRPRMDEHPDYVTDILAHGERRARTVAEATMADVRSAMQVG